MHGRIFPSSPSGLLVCAEPYPVGSLSLHCGLTAVRSGEFCCYGIGALGLVPDILTSRETLRGNYSRAMFRHKSLMARYTRSGISVVGSNGFVARRLSYLILPNVAEGRLVRVYRRGNVPMRRHSCALRRLGGTSRVVISSSNTLYVPTYRLSNRPINNGTPRVVGALRSTCLGHLRSRYNRWGSGARLRCNYFTWVRATLCSFWEKEVVVSRGTLASLGVNRGLSGLTGLSPHKCKIYHVLCGTSHRCANVPAAVGTTGGLYTALGGSSVMCVVANFILLSRRRTRASNVMDSVLLTETLSLTFSMGPIVVYRSRGIRTIEGVSEIVNLRLCSAVRRVGTRPISVTFVPFAGSGSGTRTLTSRVVSGKVPGTMVTGRFPNTGNINRCRGTMNGGAATLRTGNSVLFAGLRGTKILGVTVNSLKGRLNVNAILSRVGGCIPCASRGSGYMYNYGKKVTDIITTSGVVATAISS